MLLSSDNIGILSGFSSKYTSEAHTTQRNESKEAVEQMRRENEGSSREKDRWQSCFNSLFERLLLSLIVVLTSLTRGKQQQNTTQMNGGKVNFWMVVSL